MSYPETTALIAYCPNGWDDVRSHPAMAWMEKYTNMFDSRAFDLPYSDWHTSDFTLHKADGAVVTGGEAAWAAVKDLYSPFKANLHDPTFIVCWETKDGWEMIGQANMCADLPGSGGQKKKKDRNGKEWDVLVPSGFHFEYVKDDNAKHDGIKLRRTEILADSGPVLVELMKRGMLKPEQLMQ